ncbi:MAG: amidohydrolase [Anaerolineae bacterium]|nr:amidohydrolase [Anaerolineae bacterium]
MNPNLILHNARIYTVDPAQPWAEAVACANGRIVAVGRNADVLNLAGPQTQAIDLQGRLLVPGFTDSHVHFLQVAIRRQQVSLYGESDFDEVRRRIRAAVEQTGPGMWVQGWGWDDNLWDVTPTAALLDELAPHTPVILYRLDMHSVWVNSAAMRQANLTAATPDPPESKIDRDDAGQPTGLLREWNAIALVEQHVPGFSDDILRPWLQETIGVAHSLGLTSIHDQRVEREGRRSFRLWQSLERSGELKLRVHMHIAADYLAEAATLGLRPGFGSERLWLGHAKAFADGSLGSETARMLEPYEGSANTGLTVTSADELWELAVQADKAGFPLSIHAIGDRAVREVTDVLSEFPRDTAAGQLPHRIEHVQIIQPDDMRRMGERGIVASVQPVHLVFDWRTANRVWGQRTQYTYAFRSLLDAGVALAFGSDAPVAPLDPMPGIHAAATRQDERDQPAGGWHPAERLTMAEIIHGYTLAPAQLSGHAHLQGSITPGKWADMISFDRNLFEIDPAEIKETKVAMTVFDGEVVFGG